MIAWPLIAALAVGTAGSPVPPATAPAQESPAAASSPAPDLAAQARPPVPPGQVMALPEALRARFREQVLRRHVQPLARLQALVDFMFAPDGLALHYEEDATLTVAEAAISQRANCLTFTLLAIVLAREAGIEAYPQAFDRALTWRREQDIIYNATHVNAGIRIGGRRYSIDVASDDILTDRPPKIVGDDRLLADFYNNRAVDAMAAGRTQEALAAYAQALALDPGYAVAWNNLGVQRMRLGDPDGALSAYRRALALAPRDAGALFNLTMFYERRGDTAQAALMRKRLEREQARDPFHYFLLATAWEKQGQLANAIRAYRRAIALYPREPRFHAALANAYAAAGERRRAERSLARAQELSDTAQRARSSTALAPSPHRLGPLAAEVGTP